MYMRQIEQKEVERQKTYRDTAGHDGRSSLWADVPGWIAYEREGGGVLVERVGGGCLVGRSKRESRTGARAANNGGVEGERSRASERASEKRERVRVQVERLRVRDCKGVM